MTKRADQLHRNNAPAHCTALVQAFFFGKASHHPGLSAPLQPWFGFLWLLVFPKVKIGIESEEMGEWDGHTVHKLSQRHLTADWLAPRESDCSRKHSNVPSDGPPSHIKATWPVLEIFKMARYFLDSPHMCVCVCRYSIWLDTFWTALMRAHVCVCVCLRACVCMCVRLRRGIAITNHKLPVASPWPCKIFDLPRIWGDSAASSRRGQ